MKRPACSARCTLQWLENGLLLITLQSPWLTSVSPEPTHCSSEIPKHKHIHEKAHCKLMTNGGGTSNKITDMTLTFGLSEHWGLKRHPISLLSQKVLKPSTFWKAQIYGLGSSARAHKNWKWKQPKIFRIFQLKNFYINLFYAIFIKFYINFSYKIFWFLSFIKDKILLHSLLNISESSTFLPFKEVETEARKLNHLVRARDVSKAMKSHDPKLNSPITSSYEKGAKRLTA